MVTEMQIEVVECAAIKGLQTMEMEDLQPTEVQDPLIEVNLKSNID